MLIREWSKTQGLVFFLAIALLYVYPLILADYVYIDDGFRSVTGDANWNSEGRFLIRWLYNVLSLSGNTPDAFPLLLILTTALIAWAMSHLMWHYFSVGDLFCAIVVLPLFFNPFFLSNLSYQYDGPVMTVGLAAIAFSITFQSENRWLRAGVPILMIWIALAIYQPLINLLLGLWCIELYRKLINGEEFSVQGLFVVEKSAQALAALVIYLVTALPFMAGNRLRMIGLDAKLYDTVIERFAHIYQLTSELYQGSGRVFFVGMLVLAISAFIADAVRVIGQRRGGWHKVLAGVLYVAVPFGLIGAVPGVMLLFSDEQNDSRLLLGVGPLLIYVLLLIHGLLNRVHAHCQWLLIMPLLFMINFSYSYGRVLVAKKQLENTLANSLSYSISSNPQLSALGRIYFSADTTRLWLPAAQGTFTVIPIIPYVMSTNFLLLPDGMSRVGLTNVDSEDSLHPAQAVIESQVRPLVDNKFYSIFVFKGDGYIIMKKMSQ